MDDTKITPSQKTRLFGPDWSGLRCCAKTRSGKPCQKPALKHNARCQLHGGRGGAPTGTANGNYRHGNFTKEAIAKRAAARRRVADLLLLGKSIGMFR